MRKTAIFTLLLGVLCTVSVFANKNPFKSKKELHQIKSVQNIDVECLLGTVPVLPWQVYVTYTDGTKEWRQTRWTNTSLRTERSQADAQLHPVGANYKVTGFVIGDNTTEQGYPITANVTVVGNVSVPDAEPVAHPLPLCDVELTGTNRLTHNRELDVENLLKINYKQMLYNYRVAYGLPTDGYPVSDGWDSPTTKLKGHGTGHYLSALAFAYATEQDAVRKKKILGILRAMTDEMRMCQERTFVYDNHLKRYREARDYAPEDSLKKMKGNWKAFDAYQNDYAHYGYGYLNAIPAAHPALIECYRAYNNEDWVWAPYYSIHKQLAGLIDIALNVDNREVADKALLIAKDMGLWVWNRLHYRTYVKTDGTKQERQAKPGNRYEMWNMYIAGEVGGMAESMARLSTMVSDPAEKAHLLEGASYFDAPAFFEPVARNIDDVRTRHANQHIPMIVGALRNYMAGGDKRYYHLASNFWNMVQGRYVYAMGGVGNGEMFRQPYSQMLSMNTNVQSNRRREMIPNPDLNETCCAYNLAKLTKDLNMLNPDNAQYMDYYERVLMNQIVGSVNAGHYGVTYQYAVGLNASKPFGSETPQSTCCGGTGAENHLKYQEAAYFVNDSTMWIAQYMPTTAYWRQKSIIVTQECQWPAEDIIIRFKNEQTTADSEDAHTGNGGKARFALKVRIPYWATNEYVRVELNGKIIAGRRPAEKSKAPAVMPCSYVEIPEQEWTDDDVVRIHLPYTGHICYGHDKMEVAAVVGNTSKRFEPKWLGAVMYGPLVLATPQVADWNDAVFKINAGRPNLERNTLPGNADDGTGSPLYSFHLIEYTNTPSRWDQPAPRHISMVPDYYATGRTTHYLRLDALSGSSFNEKEQLKINRQMLEVALETAHDRQAEQEAWNALSIKVPEHAPWAAHGYSRLARQMQEASQTASSQTADAKAVGEALSAINAAINNMRPGNLAEPEDLEPLMPVLSNAKAIAVKPDNLRDAIDYAEMVVQYVNDGSGTHDLIHKAIERLTRILEVIGK